MMTEICEYLHNWFCEDSDMVIGTITIRGGHLTVPDNRLPQVGQYIRIVGSVFNDGVLQYGTDMLMDETFDGAVWLMRVPPAVISLASEIAEWQTKYGGTSSKALSPFNSESFAGYSYSKSSGVGTGNSSDNPATWQGAYAARLAIWRKI